MLSGKSLVVIGGTTGLGLSGARAFAAAGARVVIVGQKPDEVEAALSIPGNAARGFVADAVDSRTAPDAIELALEQFENLGIAKDVTGS